MNSTDIEDLRRSMIRFLRRANREGRMSESKWGTGRGLVFTAGNAVSFVGSYAQPFHAECAGQKDTFSRVLLSLKLLNKHLDSPLPSEIFSFPGHLIKSDSVIRWLMV